jgi:hypothetical protein
VLKNAQFAQLRNMDANELPEHKSLCGLLLQRMERQTCARKNPATRNQERDFRSRRRHGRPPKTGKYSTRAAHLIRGG